MESQLPYYIYIYIYIMRSVSEGVHTLVSRKSQEDVSNLSPKLR